MTIFNQQGQQVNNQYNAAGDIHFGPISNTNELIVQLQQLSSALSQAIVDGRIDTSAGTSANEALKNAVSHLGNPDVHKATLIGYLVKAKEILTGITAAGGLVQGITHLIQVIRGLFV